MRAMRQDAWTAEDDRVLADILIRHIRQGSTQLAAFEEAASLLGRTAAACGYRWNAVVRSEYREEIAKAKSERKAAVIGMKSQELTGHNTVWNFASSSMEQPETAFKSKNGAGVSTTWLQILNFLRTYKKEQSELASTIETYEARLLEKEQAAETLAAEKERLQLQVDQLNEQYQAVRDEYYSLLTIVDRARRISEENMT